MLHFLCLVFFLDMEYTFNNVRFGCKRVFFYYFLKYFFIDCSSYFINVGFICIVSFLCHIDISFEKKNDNGSLVFPNQAYLTLKTMYGDYC